MGDSIKNIVLLFIFMFLTTSLVQGQVTIAPTHVFMDGKTNFASFLVLNGTEQAQEVTVSFEFGYLDSDSLGNTKMNYDDSVKARNFSIADDIRGFPQSFLLQPDQRQTVRLRMTNAQDYSEGTYWTRIKTISNPQSPPIEASSEEEVTAQVNFRFEQVTTVLYQKGNLTTGINFEDIYTRTVTKDSVLQVLSEVERTGNSPALGSIEITVTDENKNEIYEQRRTITLYFDGVHRFDIPFSELHNGKKYTAEIRYLPQRNDISEENIIQFDPISKSTTFTYQ